MIEPIPIYGEEAYAIMYNKFGTDSFNHSYLKWFLSASMTKKIFHILETKGWIERVERGKYKCRKPEEIIKGLVQFRVPELLDQAGKVYCYSKMSAVEIWTDYTYMQRSWEHSPYHIKVLESDASFWLAYLRSHGISVSFNKAKASIGESVILYPKKTFDFVEVKKRPVDKIDETTKYCEKNISMFEYPLAYLVKKYGLKTTAKIDPRVSQEVERWN